MPLLLSEQLHALYPQTPKYDLSFALERGRVRVGGQTVWADGPLRSGEKVTLDPWKFPTADDVGGMIVFEDEHFLILNKPFGVPSQPTADRKRLNMVDLLRDYIWKRDHAVFEPGVVHRLDKDTSGVILYLKNKQLHAKFDRLFQSHRIQKTYVAQVAGVPSPPESTWLHELSEFPDESKKVLCRPLAPNAESENRKARISEQDSIAFRLAKTHFRVIETVAGVTLLELKPVTGRMHQLRAQCAFEGYPMLGDALYAPPEHRRHAVMYLHAQQLEFRHPVTQKVVKIQVGAEWNNPG